MEKTKMIGKSFAYALRTTYTIGISWIPVAVAFGLIVRESGVPFYWAGLSCFFCPCGSLQMLIFSFLMTNVSIGTVLAASFAVGFRHLFYGLSFLERFRKFGASKHYMIYMLCDELYSVYCAMCIPMDLNEKYVHIASAVLLQFYWMALSTLGALFGAAIPFDLSGVDFALTALFVVILLEILLESKTKLPAICAAICGISSLLVFGPDDFLIPALLSTSAILILLRRCIEQIGKEASADV